MMKRTIVYLKSGLNTDGFKEHDMFGWSGGLSSSLVAMLWYFHLEEILE